jgi:3-dehydroquinate dehydratase/shikimate dehydrogenase
MRESLGWNDAGVLYKLAAHARSTEDALRLLLFCRKAGQGRKVIGVSMGEYGESANILAPVAHSGFCYCPVEERPSPGQLPAQVLRDVYNFKHLNKDTAVYGLIGDPVEQSRAHVYHNERNAWHGCNAVYVKWRLGRSWLGKVLPLLEQLGVRGLSVLPPLKEATLAHLKDVSPQLRVIGAINTLKAADGGWSGLNTDGAGALACLPPRLRNLTGKKVVVLGAGSAGRAIIHALDTAGASVLVYNRTINKTLPWDPATHLPIRPLDKRAEIRDLECDLIINALPALDISFTDMTMPTGALAMDISYGAPSSFLQAARTSGCETLDGGGMFAAQAALQRRFWGLP